jgi:large subunit ribosomal protein L8e
MVGSMKPYNGYIREIVMDVSQDHGRGTPLCKVTFMHAFYHKNQKNLFVDAEGLYSKQFLYCGKNEGGSTSLSRERERTKHSGLDQGRGETAGAARSEP